jgi:predicted Zn-dependent peptidase
MVRLHLPEGNYETNAARILGVTKADVEVAAEKIVPPKQWVWVIVGNRSKIEPRVLPRTTGTSFKPASVWIFE